MRSEFFFRQVFSLRINHARLVRAGVSFVTVFAQLRVWKCRKKGGNCAPGAFILKILLSIFKTCFVISPEHHTFAARFAKQKWK